MVGLNTKEGHLLVVVSAAVTGICISTVFAFSWSLYVFGLFLSGVFGILIYVKIALDVSPPIKVDVKTPKILEAFHSVILESIKSDERMIAQHASKKEAPVFSRNIDKEINSLMSKILEDYLLSGIGSLINDEESKNNIRNIILSDLWEALQRLERRLSEIDKVHFLVNGLYTMQSKKCSRYICTYLMTYFLRFRCIEKSYSTF